MTIQFHTAYSDAHRTAMLTATAISFEGDPGMTLQAPAEDADLNVIMKRFGVKDGAKLPRWTNANAMYGDVSDMPEDVTEIAETLRQGELAFKILPANIRNRFQTGTTLYEWLRNPANGEEAVQLGLLQKIKLAGVPGTPQTDPPPQTP